ncbi:hypothetical protein J4H92_03755 [Leucobacter weissii]|uniref:Mannose-6-phosphate isomerase n=1 Tax=Leucobacter weissii TaxID=1983706 RepID=A0A939MHL1_9MICO|nr:class I mannose-6-phosphate isomerase [Leucobacter weissii]MBO1901064.1 hypothetical protein [Leucobacter weissii]
MSDPGIVELEANRPGARPYRGGSGIAGFRGVPHADPYLPEDFLASTTEVFAGGGVGLSRLADGRLLRDAIAADPIGFLGSAEAGASGGTGLLTKLLSTDERLFIHAHPDDAFARAHGLGSCGKTESWFVFDVAQGADAFVLLGFRRDVGFAELTGWFDDQDVAGMTDAMHRIPVQTGDTFHVPAGLPHGIGPGLTLVELQQATDLSVLLEYAGYPGIDRDGALLALPRDEALRAFRRSRLDDEELAELRTSRPASGRTRALFPAAADRFYRARHVRAGRDPVRLETGFAVLVVLGGAGRLSWEGGSLEAERGRTFLVRHDAGPVSVGPGLELLSCRPPRSRGERSGPGR